jgi:hypothetical protein
MLHIMIQLECSFPPQKSLVKFPLKKTKSHNPHRRREIKF